MLSQAKKKHDEMMVKVELRRSRRSGGTSENTFSGFGFQPMFPVTPDENFHCHFFCVVRHSTGIRPNAGYIQIQQFLAHRIPFLLSTTRYIYMSPIQ